jgi:hypothetical protein
MGCVAMTVQRLPQVIGSVRVHHHWHAQSEQYAGADCLVTLVEAGWSVGPMARMQEHWPSGTRRTVVYHFELTRDNDVQFMAVIHNPYVDRLIKCFNVHTIPMARRIEIRRPQKIIFPTMEPALQRVSANA